MARIVHTDLDEIIAHFSKLEDPPSDINQKHPLTSVLVIALRGVLAQCTGPTSIAVWAKQK